MQKKPFSHNVKMVKKKIKTYGFILNIIIENYLLNPRGLSTSSSCSWFSSLCRLASSNIS